MLQTARTKHYYYAALKHTSALVVIFYLSGCATFFMGDRALNRNPIENPTVNITNFSDSLSCMDELLLYYDAPIITITAQDIPNMTGGGDNIAGTKDMLITSISKLSERSRRIRFVSYGTDLRDIILLHKTHEQREQFVTPDYFIRGAITQLDKNVLSSRIGSAAHDDSWNSTFSGGQGVSFAGMDLNVGLVSTLQMIPGVTSNNVLALWDRGTGVDLGGRISSVGTFFDFGIDRRDGVGQAIRNMTDLAVIETIGKLLKIPYMSCLPLNQHSPQVQQLIQREYADYVQTPDKLIRIIQAKLKQLQLFHGEVNGVMNRQTALALEYFHNLYGSRGLTQKPRTLDFQLYYDIMYAKHPKNITSPLLNAQFSPSVEWRSAKQLSYELDEPYDTPRTKAPTSPAVEPKSSQGTKPSEQSPDATKKKHSKPSPTPSTGNRPSKHPLEGSTHANQGEPQISATTNSDPKQSLRAAIEALSPNVPSPTRQSNGTDSATVEKTPKNTVERDSADYWEQRFTQELNAQDRFRPPSVQEVIQGM